MRTRFGMAAAVSLSSLLTMVSPIRHILEIGELSNSLIALAITMMAGISGPSVSSYSRKDTASVLRGLSSSGSRKKCVTDRAIRLQDDTDTTWKSPYPAID